MKKVLFIKNIPSPYRIDFFNELGKKVNLTVWFENEKVDSRQWKSEVKNKNFKYKFFNFNSNKKIKNIINVLKELKSQKYDVYIIGGYSTPIGIISILYLKLNRKKFILNADGGFIKKDKKINYIIKKMLISSASYWLSSGDNCSKYLLYYGAKEEFIFKYPFASVEYESKLLKDISCKEKLNIKDRHNLEDIVIISVGSFIDIKGLDILIRAFHKIQYNYNMLNVSLLLIGGGPLSGEYKKYIKSNNITNVEIINFLDKEELTNYYKISDIFVFPTKGDVWGLVINEAMEFGLPIIASSMAGAAYDLMIDGTNGYMFKSEDVDDLYEKISILIIDKEKRLEFGNNSRSIISKYSTKQMSDIHYNIIELVN